MGDKKILGLLNGLSKRDFYGDEGMTDAFLKEQLFPDVDDENFQNILRQYDGILNNMVYSDMDSKQLDAYLVSLINKKENSITVEQMGEILKFWNSNRQKLHLLMVEKSTFNSTLKSFKWRVDIDYKDNTQSCEPKVIFEIGVKSQPGCVAEESFVFESSADSLERMIKHTDDIEGAISKILK